MMDKGTVGVILLGFVWWIAMCFWPIPMLSIEIALIAAGMVYFNGPELYRSIMVRYKMSKCVRSTPIH